MRQEHRPGVYASDYGIRVNENGDVNASCLTDLRKVIKNHLHDHIFGIRLILVI